MKSIFFRILMIFGASLTLLACGKPTVRIHMGAEARGIMDVSKYTDRDLLYVSLQAYDALGNRMVGASADASAEVSEKLLSWIPKIKVCKYDANTTYFQINGKEFPYINAFDDFYFELDPASNQHKPVDFLATRNSPREYYLCSGDEEQVMWLPYSLMNTVFDENGKPKNSPPTGPLP